MKICNYRIFYLMLLATAVFVLLGLQGQANAASDRDLYYRPIYIINGTIESPAGHSPVGKKVILFWNNRLVSLSNVTAEVQSDSSYFMNIFGNIYQKSNFASDAIPQYFVFISNEATDPTQGYGADPVPVVLTGKGIEAANLKYRLGGGSAASLNAGAIQGLTITKEASNIKLVWIVLGKADVWRLAGLSKEYSTIEVWTLVSKEVTFDPSLSPLNFLVATYTDSYPVASGQNPVRTGDGINAYYRVIASGTIPGVVVGTTSNDARIFDLNVNPITVGKVDVNISANDQLLINSPVIDKNVSDVFSSQLPTGKIVYLYPRSGKGLDKVTASRGTMLGTDFPAKPALGFWIENPNADPLTFSFVGALPSTMSNIIEKLDLTGNPLPVSLNSGNLGGEPGDNLYPQSGKGLDKITKTANWRSFTLKVGDGFWYEYATDNRKWQVDLSTLSSKIVKY